MTVTKFGPRSGAVVRFLEELDAPGPEAWVAFGERLKAGSQQDLAVLGHGGPPRAGAAVLSALDSATRRAFQTTPSLKEAEVTSITRNRIYRSVRLVSGVVAFPEQYSDEQKEVMVDQYAALGIDLAPLLEDV